VKAKPFITPLNRNVSKVSSASLDILGERVKTKEGRKAKLAGKCNFSNDLVRSEGLVTAKKNEKLNPPIITLRTVLKALGRPTKIYDIPPRKMTKGIIA